MKFLLDERNLIVAIGSSIEYGAWGNIGTAMSWRISDAHYIVGDNYHVEDIGDMEIPTYVKEGEYYYIDGEFKPVEEYPNVYDEMAAAITEGVNEV